MVRLRDVPADVDVHYPGGSRDRYLTRLLEAKDYRCETCGASVLDTALFATAEASRSSVEHADWAFTTEAASLECAGCGGGVGVHVGLPKNDTALQKMRDVLDAADDTPPAESSSTATSRRDPTPGDSAAHRDGDVPREAPPKVLYKTPWTKRAPDELEKPEHPAIALPFDEQMVVEDSIAGVSTDHPTVIDGDPRAAAEGGESSHAETTSLVERVRAALARLAR